MTKTKEEDLHTDIPKSLTGTMVSSPWLEIGGNLDDTAQVILIYSKAAQYSTEWTIWEQTEIHTKEPEFESDMIKGHINLEGPTFVWDSKTNRLEKFISEQIFEIPEVEAVVFSKTEDSMDIWTVINAPDKEIKKKIYNVEYDILDLFGELNLDFHLICRYDKDFNELYPLDAKIRFQR